jgi:hypothetical protein
MSIAILFSEDIRQEVGNKLSIMGLLSGELTFETLPASLPVLCFTVAINNESFERWENAQLDIKMGSVQAFSHPMLSPDKKPNAVFSFRLLNLNFLESCDIVVSISKDGDTLAESRLPIKSK